MAESIFEMQSGVDLYGELPDFVIEDMEVDKLGVLTAAVRVPRAFPLNMDWLLPWKAPAFFGGVPCSKIRAGLQEREGICNLIYSYEGVAATGGDFSFPLDQTQCEIDCQSMAAAITTHPRFLYLAKRYGAKFNPADKDDFWYFGKTLPKATQGDVPYDPDNTLGIKSPMYGVDSYQAPRLVFRRTILTATIPDTLTDGVGFIDDAIKLGLEGQGPRPPMLKGRENWLKAMLRGQWRGNIWSVTTEWWASSNGYGWNEDIYRRNA